MFYVLGVLVAGGIWFISARNGFVKLSASIANAWSQVEVQLKRRYDLIPNLVETVKGYKNHERETLEAVIQARNQAVAAGNPQEQGLAEGMLGAALGRIFALSEAYPELKADANFRQLTEELSNTENRIAYARQHHNDVVTKYNALRLMFPWSFAASGFGAADLFDIPDDCAAHDAPSVSF
ncbi:LemA family protein [bacterium]|nr:LemA family protein [bacterium]